MMSGNGRRDISAQSLIEAMQKVLNDALPNNIISGLEVTEADPVSNKIIITAGKGSTGGIVYELSEDTTISVPFDNTTRIFYINLYKNIILFDKKQDSTKLNIAKIIVPNPGTTNRVKDRREDDYEWDAYIVNMKTYYLHGINNQLEEDSIDLLKDNIGDILADNLIGNIRLSENLKIINTSGTLELDSQSIKILNEDEDTMAKFNKDGTFFYNSIGIEVAKFSVDGAKIGNINIYNDRLESGNFVSGALGSGFQIKDNGDAEFNNIYARGKFTTTVFVKETINSVGGSLLVSNSDILDTDMTALDASTLTISGDTTFAVGDMLRIKDGTDDEWFEVTNVGSAPIYTVTRDKNSQYITDNNPIWKKGTAVVSFGASGEGLIFMTASETNAPYLSVVTHAGSPWDTLTTRMRFGNLKGYLGYVSDKYGLAVGETNKYLKYDPTNGLRIQGDITISGDSGSIKIYDDTVTERIRIGNLNGFLDYSSAEYGLAIGETTKYLKYDVSNGLRIRGNIDADSGNLGVMTIDGALSVGTAGSIGSGQTAYDTGTGFWLEYNSATPRFSIGNSAGNKLTWNGSALSITGVITAEAGSSGMGGNSNQLLGNGDFEKWAAGDALAPDDWDLVGAGAAIAKEDTIIKLGTYSAKITRGGTDCRINQSIHATRGISYWQGRTVTLSCWVYATVADRAYLRVQDGVGIGQSTAHTGASAWELLTVTRVIDAAADKVRIDLDILTGDTSAYFDGAMLVDGSTSQPYAPKNYSQEWISSSDTTKIDGGNIYTDTITATQISVTNLSAISADLGTITAGTITGTTIQTAVSGSRILMDTDKLVAYDDSSSPGAEIFKILLTGGEVGDVIIGDSTGDHVKWDASEAELLLTTQGREINIAFSSPWKGFTGGFGGDGSDGAYDTGVSGDDTISGGTKQYTNLTIKNGNTITADRAVVGVNGTLTIESGGILSCKGGGAAGGTASANSAGTAGTAGDAEGCGGSGGGGGGSNHYGGGTGGKGGGGPIGGTGVSGGAGGGTLSNGGAGNPPTASWVAYAKSWARGDRLLDIGDGGGGGAGGSQGTSRGGAGGYGGGFMYIECEKLDFQTGGIIIGDGNNGAGGSGHDGEAAGGGGGGGGGCVWVRYGTLIADTGTGTADGGNYGSGGDGGGRGGVGGDGTYYKSQ